METVRRDFMLTLPVDTNPEGTLLSTGLHNSSQLLYSRLAPETWRKIFSFLVPEHLRIPRYNRGWMGKEWKRLDDFLKLTAVFRYAQDDLYQTLCSECTFSVADGVRQKNTMTVVPAIERAAEFFGNIGLKHFRHVKSIQFIITGDKTGTIKLLEAKRMLDALEILLHHCSPSMKLKDAQLRCHASPVEYYYLDTGNRMDVPGFAFDGPKPHLSFIGPRNKNLKAFGRGLVSLEMLNETLMHRHDKGRSINFMHILPPELRLEVYDILMVDAPTEYAVKKRGPPKNDNSNDVAALLAVNAEMRHDLSRLLYSKCQFRFNTRWSITSLEFMDKIGLANAAYVRDVIITFVIRDGRRVPTIKALLSKLPNFSTLNLNARNFRFRSITIQRVRPSFPGQVTFQRECVYSIPETGGNNLEFRAVYLWTWPIGGPFWQSGQMQLKVVPQAFQASIDGMDFTVGPGGLLLTCWPAGIPTTEKDTKAKKIRK
ncbi:hypothetical protein MMC18_001949 [Xylographa bjoerkii]|nr:hypothetical protein [Xylographa bjoerkii]